MTAGSWWLRSIAVGALAVASMATAQPVRPTGSSTVLAEPAWSRTVAGAKQNEFVAPNGTVLNGNYVRFLRRAVPGARLRLKGLLDPIVVVLDGKVIGVFMPIKPETPAARLGRGSPAET
jgi:hypothetical protein